MMVVNEMGLIQLLKLGLEPKVRRMLHEQVATPIIEELTEQVHSIVREAVEQVTIEGVDSFRDCLNLRDELIVGVIVNGKE